MKKSIDRPLVPCAGPRSRRQDREEVFFYRVGTNDSIKTLHPSRPSRLSGSRRQDTLSYEYMHSGLELGLSQWMGRKNRAPSRDSLPKRSPLLILLFGVMAVSFQKREKRCPGPRTRTSPGRAKRLLQVGHASHRPGVVYQRLIAAAVAPFSSSFRLGPRF